MSTKSAAELIARMRNLAAEFEEMHRDDLALAIGQRHGTSVLLAVRPWEPKLFRALRRAQPAEVSPRPGGVKPKQPGK